MLITGSDIGSDEKTRRLRGYARVEQILIGQRRELAAMVDVSMADPIIDRSMELPPFRGEKKGQLF